MKKKNKTGLIKGEALAVDAESVSRKELLHLAEFVLSRENTQ